MCERHAEEWVPDPNEIVCIFDESLVCEGPLVKYVPAEQLRGAVSAVDDAHQVILDALSSLHPEPARRLMEAPSYKAFAAYVKRGQ
jgi:hypothetical protein